MTTAGRATFDTAKGGKGKWEDNLGSLSTQISVRDLPSHTKLKYRKDGQSRPEEIRERNLKREFEEKDKQKYKSIGSNNEKSSDSGSAAKRVRIDKTSANIDKDEHRVNDSDEDSEYESDDDELLLQAELLKIKEERAREQAKKDAEKAANEEKIKLTDLTYSFDRKSENFNIRKKWDADYLFNNCAKGEVDCAKRGFINDTLRSEFHKKFMSKYIQ